MVPPLGLLSTGRLAASRQRFLLKLRIATYQLLTVIIVLIGDPGAAGRALRAAKAGFGVRA
jgi:hypothetical protein